MTFFTIENIKANAGGRWLQRPTADAEMHGVGIDTRDDLRGRVFIAIRGERFDGHAFLHAATKAGSPLLIIDRELAAAELPPDAGVILVDNARKALGRLALAYRRAHRAKVIAVVGSAGKTTTKRLIDAVLATSLQGSASPKSFNNDIGVPLTLLNAKPSDKYIVVEVGTNHLGEIVHLASLVEPDIAVITMIGREHLEGLGSLENIANENAAILQYLRPGGLAVVNADSPLLRRHMKRAPSVVLFGEASDADLRLTDRGMNADGLGWWFEVNQRTKFNLSQPGRHNAMNALAAVAVGRRMGIPDARISDGLRSAEGAPMRMTMQSIGGIAICNDAYNANPESMLAALDAFAEIAATADRRILVLGDMLELGSAASELHREIGRRILQIDAKFRIDHVVLVGELSALIASDLSRAWSDGRCTSVKAIDGASGRQIAQLLRSGDSVLIKASRGMGLERLLPMIGEQQNLASPANVPTVSTPVAAGSASC